MAPGGVEPPHADSKSAALPLSYGATLQFSVTETFLAFVGGGAEPEGTVLRRTAPESSVPSAA
jgi:hypothetical protein